VGGNDSIANATTNCLRRHAKAARCFPSCAKTQPSRKLGNLSQHGSRSIVLVPRHWVLLDVGQVVCVALAPLQAPILRACKTVRGSALKIHPAVRPISLIIKRCHWPEHALIRLAFMLVQTELASRPLTPPLSTRNIN
jgi:hypothetical protein